MLCIHLTWDAGIYYHLQNIFQNKRRALRIGHQRNKILDSRFDDNHRLSLSFFSHPFVWVSHSVTIIPFYLKLSFAWKLVNIGHIEQILLLMSMLLIAANFNISSDSLFFSFAKHIIMQYVHTFTSVKQYRICTNRQNDSCQSIMVLGYDKTSMHVTNFENCILFSMYLFI